MYLTGINVTPYVNFVKCLLKRKKMTVVESILKTLVKERNVYRLSGKEAGQLTKECLQLALVDLMAEKPFEKITVTELVLKSGVSRQSFYRNYESKEDILKDLHQGMEDAVMEIADDVSEDDSYSWFERFFSYLGKNGEYFGLLMKAREKQQSNFSFLPSLKEIFRLDDKAEQYRMCAYEGGLNAICKEWIAGGMTESVEDMAHLCDSIFGNIHKRLMQKG